MNKNDIFYNDEYILWLNNFINEHKDFNTDDIITLFSNLKEEDKVNISRIEELYETISLYARDNNIFPNFYLLGNYYKIKYNEKNKFIVGKSIVDSEENYYCKKGLPFGKYINYSDIVDYYLSLNIGRKR